MRQAIAEMAVGAIIIILIVVLFAVIADLNGGY